MFTVTCFKKVNKVEKQLYLPSMVLSHNKHSAWFINLKLDMACQINISIYEETLIVEENDKIVNF